MQLVATRAKKDSRFEHSGIVRPDVRQPQMKETLICTPAAKKTTRLSCLMRKFVRNHGFFFAEVNGFRWFVSMLAADLVQILTLLSFFSFFFFFLKKS